MADECSLEPRIGAKYHSRGPRDRDREIAELAERQHGVVSRRQLLALGLGRRAIGDRLARGRLHALHAGVYAVGHRVLGAHGRYMAAVLAAGPGAVLSHRSAGALWGVIRSTRGRVEVTSARQRRLGRVIQAHRSQLPVDQIAVRNGIPVTTAPRTLLDLAAVLDAPALELAMEAAEARRLRVTWRQLREDSARLAADLRRLLRG